MDLPDKIVAIENVFSNLDQAISSFQETSGLHCKWGCGKCCFKADIEATILEFLPFANQLYQSNLAFAWLEKLKKSDSTICMILNPTQDGAGLCSSYQHRGLICRLFGYSARTNKYGKAELVTCQIIKNEQAENVSKVDQDLTEGGTMPIMNQYYMQLHAIDIELTREFFPINEAIKRAIEVILHYHAYRD